MGDVSPANLVKKSWEIMMFEKIFEGEFQSRILHTKDKGLDFITPDYIPSFSSRDDRYLKERINSLLDMIPQQTILISAYDYYNLKSKGYITSKFIENSFKEKLLFLDSGGYELQFSKRDDWNRAKYKSVLGELNPNFFVGYDRIPSYEVKSNTSEIINNGIGFLKEFSENKGHVLLLHFSIKNKPVEEIKTISSLLEQYIDYFDVIGFPEREIGANIIQRTIFVKKLREELDTRDIIKPLHVFGCSDPTSIILYVLAGADLFDGLGWIKYAFDKENLLNVERSQLPFLDCDCLACKNENWDEISSDEYEYRLLTHNLYAYDNLFYQLRDRIIRDELEDMFKTKRLNYYLEKIRW